MSLGLYRRRLLAEALRRKLPCVWAYGVIEVETYCGAEGCALLVAKYLWPGEFPELVGQFDRSSIDLIGEFFGIRPLQVIDVFFRGDPCEVSAADVADRLEALDEAGACVDERACEAGASRDTVWSGGISWAPDVG